MHIEVPILFAIAQTIHYGNITSLEMSTHRNMSAAFVLILSLGFKFMQKCGVTFIFLFVFHTTHSACFGNRFMVDPAQLCFKWGLFLWPQLVPHREHNLSVI